MGTKWKWIKLLGALVVVMALFAFSNHRSQLRKPTEISLKFLGDDRLFITQDAVNKLLIQNYGSLENLPKDEVVLDSLEQTILANDMIKNAHVYYTVNGQLKANIVQRTPIGRVQGNDKFYLDDEGKRMPLSPFYAARVPIITGVVTGDALAQIYELLKYVNQDGFLRKNLIGIHVVSDNDFQLRFRMEDFVVELGAIEKLPQKFANFKAFYAKATKDKILGAYRVVSLEFDNQVVCTKI